MPNNNNSTLELDKTISQYQSKNFDLPTTIQILISLIEAGNDDQLRGIEVGRDISKDETLFVNVSII